MPHAATSEKFIAEFNCRYKWDKISSYFMAYIFFAISFFLTVFKWDHMVNSRFSPVIFMVIFFILSGLFAFVTLKHKYDLHELNNNLDKTQNEQLVKKLLNHFVREDAENIKPQFFIWYRGVWRTSFSVHFFADEGYILINVMQVGGLANFGAKRMTEKFINYLAQNCECNPL